MSSYVNIPCENCGKETIFAEDPYNTPGATKYWKSTFQKVNEFLFIVERKTPYRKKNGKVAIQISHERILEVYCGVECGLKRYQS